VFVLGFTGAVVWVVFCIFNGQDLVAADYYEREVVHQEQMERAQRGLALGTSATVAFDSHTRCIVIRLPGDHAAAGPTGSIELYRPSEAGLDRTLPLNLAASGAQMLGTTELKPGLWRVRVTWSVKGEEHFLDEKIEIEPSGT
jgi:nitrogen fixation protein FixH